MLSRLFQFSLALIALALFVGCPAKEKEDYQAYNDADKNEAGHDHDHGHSHDHEHEAGPHGGHIVELTDDHSVHLEVTLDPSDRKVTLFLLGGDLETPLPVKVDEIEFELDQEDGNEVELVLTPQPLEGEAEGMASVFIAAGDKIPATVTDIEKLHGHVHVTVNGKELTGGLEHDHDEDAHEDDDHGHDDADHDHDEAEKKTEEKPKAE